MQILSFSSLQILKLEQLRRHKELKKLGKAMSYQEVLKSIKNT